VSELNKASANFVLRILTQKGFKSGCFVIKLFLLTLLLFINKFFLNYPYIENGI